MWSKKSLDVHSSPGVFHTFWVTRFTASCDIMLWWEKEGMWFQLGTVVKVGASCTNVGLRQGDFLAHAVGLSIARVIPGVLCHVFLWCIQGVAWITTGAVGFLAVVTGGAGPTLCPWATSSGVGASSTI